MYVQPRGRNALAFGQTLRDCVVPRLRLGFYTLTSLYRPTCSFFNWFRNICHMTYVWLPLAVLIPQRHWFTHPGQPQRRALFSFCARSRRPRTTIGHLLLCAAANAYPVCCVTSRVLSSLGSRQYDSVSCCFSCTYRLIDVCMRSPGTSRVPGVGCCDALCDPRGLSSPGHSTLSRARSMEITLRSGSPR